MISVSTRLLKYVIAVLTVIYTFRCFAFYLAKTEITRRYMYRSQHSIMFVTHFIMNVIIFLNVREQYGLGKEAIMVVALYAAEILFFIVAMYMYSHIYRYASLLLINNMFFLLMVGFVMLTRLEMNLAVKQFGIAVVSLAISLIVPVIMEKAEFLARLRYVYGALSLATVGLVFIFGRTVYGATNWVTIAGIGFQPSEIAKVIFVFFVAASLYKDTSLKRIILTTVIAAVHVLILVYETDLGAAVIFFVTYIIMLYIATRNIIWPALGLTSGAAAAVIAAKLFSHVERRVTAWLHPWENYQDAGYQVCQSLFAIMTGGWFGMGLYQGIPSDIPVVESDFIFSAICEELGCIFGICLLLVYLSCFIMFINISLQLTNNFYKLIAVGLSISYGFQVFLCIGGVIKFIPHTGVTLPLVSYGGSSILSTIIVFAVIQGLYLLKQKEVRTSEKEQRQVGLR